jgi:hypothetical protein
LAQQNSLDGMSANVDAQDEWIFRTKQPIYHSFLQPSQTYDYYVFAVAYVVFARETTCFNNY